MAAVLDVGASKATLSRPSLPARALVSSRICKFVKLARVRSIAAWVAGVPVCPFTQGEVSSNPMCSEQWGAEREREREQVPLTISQAGCGKSRATATYSDITAT